MYIVSQDMGFTTCARSRPTPIFNYNAFRTVYAQYIGVYGHEHYKRRVRAGDAERLRNGPVPSIVSPAVAAAGTVGPRSRSAARPLKVSTPRARSTRAVARDVIAAVPAL